jgi:hypothetical protein
MRTIRIVKTMKVGTIEGYNNSLLLYYKIDKMSKIIQKI